VYNDRRETKSIAAKGVFRRKLDCWQIVDQILPGLENNNE
jgi:hypothetical protein